MVWFNVLLFVNKWCNFYFQGLQHYPCVKRCLIYSKFRRLKRQLVLGIRATKWYIVVNSHGWGTAMTTDSSMWYLINTIWTGCFVWYTWSSGMNKQCYITRFYHNFRKSYKAVLLPASLKFAASHVQRAPMLKMDINTEQPPTDAARRVHSNYCRQV